MSLPPHRAAGSPAAFPTSKGTITSLVRPARLAFQVGMLISCAVRVIQLVFADSVIKGAGHRVCHCTQKLP
jgi:hypothetical protein